MTGKIRSAVVGVGQFGLKHAEKYARSGAAELVAVADIDPDRAAAVGRELRVCAVTDYRNLFDKVDAVSVAVPTSDHFEIARAFLEAGVHVLVEKPMSHSLETADKLIRLANEKGLILQVGHVERFSAVYLALEQEITRPLYFENYRIAPFQLRGTDADVILDLMIHDIDLILALVDAPVASVDAVGAPVLSTQEDIASTRMKFANGCVANITASRVGMKTERKMRIFQTDSYIAVDFVNSSLLRLRKGGRDTMPGVPSIERTEIKIAKADSLEKEISCFLASVATGRQPRVNGEVAREVLRVALMIGDSLREHRDHLMKELSL